MSLASSDECAAAVGLVEHFIADDATVSRLDLRLHRGDRRVDRGHLGVGAPRGGQSGQFHFQGFARLDDVRNPVGVFAQRLDRRFFGGWTARMTPSPWRTDNTPWTSRATSAWLSDARLTPRLAARSRSARQPVARAHLVVGDVAAQLFDDHFVQSGPRHGPKLFNH